MKAAFDNCATNGQLVYYQNGTPTPITEKPDYGDITKLKIITEDGQYLKYGQLKDVTVTEKINNTSQKVIKKEYSNSDYLFLSGVTVSEKARYDPTTKEIVVEDDYRWKSSYNADGNICLSNLKYLDLSQADSRFSSGIESYPLENTDFYKAGTNCAIPPRAFQNNATIEEIILPNNCVRTYIHAFSMMTNLKYVHTSNSTDSKTTISFPDSMVIFGEGTIYGIPDEYNSKTGALEKNYYNLNDMKLRLPNHTIYLGSSAFYLCEFTGTLDLSNVILNTKTDSPLNKSENGSIFNGSLFSSITLSSVDSKTKIPNYLITNNTVIEQIIIPEHVTAIGDSTFSGCTSLKTINFPSNLVSIGEYAFKGCSSLEGNISFADSKLETIGKGAFQNCSKVHSFTLSDKIKIIDANTFNGCKGWTGELILPSGLETIGHYAFLNCKNLHGDLIIPNSVKSIGTSAFDGCTGFTSKLNLGTGIETIGGSAFRGNGFTDYILIPPSVKVIGSNAFGRAITEEADNHALTSIIILGDPRYGDESGYGSYYFTNVNGTTNARIYVVNETILELKDKDINDKTTIVNSYNPFYKEVFTVSIIGNAVFEGMDGNIPIFTKNGIRICEWTDKAVTGYKVQEPKYHNISYVNSQDATEDSNGHIEHYTCKICNNNYEDDKGITILSVIETVFVSVSSNIENSCSFTYTVNGGVETAYTNPLQTLAGNEITITVTPDEGYRFIKWSNNSTNTSVTFSSISSAVVASATMQAIPTHTVTWKNGDVTLETDTIYEGSNPSFNGTTPSKDRTQQYTFTFDGWSTDPQSQTGTAVGSLPAVTADVTYHAIFSETVNQYTIFLKPGVNSTTDLDETWTYENGVYSKSFDYDSPIGAVQVSNGDKVLSGWYSDDATAVNIDSLTVTGDLSLTAVWTTGKTAEIEADNGNAQSIIPNDQTVDNVTVTFDDTNTTIVIPTGSVDRVKGKTIDFSVTMVGSGNNMAFDVTMTVDGTGYSGDVVIISIPYNPSRGTPDILWVEGGEKMRVISVNNISGIISFETTHNSTYALSYPTPVSPGGDGDSDDDWYQQWLQNYNKQIAEQQKQEQAQEEQKKVISVAVAGAVVVLLSVLALAVNRKS